MNMIIHDDGHTNVIACDGLLPICPKKLAGDETEQEKEALEQHNANVISQKTGNANFKENHFDFIITNPPFGSIVRQTEKAYLHQYNFGMKEAKWLDIKDKNEKKTRENQSTEVLFIEQAHRFLKEKGFLAIVIPDGILTNSSLQYVRDSIEELYRIIAVISMPQTAFSHTGAGVKSSVLFLQKHTKATSDKIKALKLSLQTRIKKDSNYADKINELESAKKQELKKLNKDYPTKEDKESKEYKEKKEKLAQNHKEQVENLQSPLFDSYAKQKSEEIHNAGLDYDIFMAIAENIGYDATGKKTGENELDNIGAKLKNFIEKIARH